MFRVGMIDRYVLHDEYLAREDVANYDKTISAVSHPVIALAPHSHTPDKKSTIAVSFFLSALDRENALFILQYAKEINEMFGTYTRLPIRFDATLSAEDITKRDMLRIQCDIDTKTGMIHTTCPDEDPVSQLFFTYLKHFEAIQHLITIFNTFIVQDASKKVRHLNNTFAIIGCYRHL